MIKIMYSVFIGVFIFLFILFSNCQKNTSFEEGLVGIYFSEPNLTSIKAYSVLTSLEQVWGQDYEYGIESSGHWNGFIIAPAEGKIRIHVETNRKIKLSLEGSDTIVADRDHPVASTEVNMLKGEKYPVDLKFWNDTQLGVFIPSDHVPQSLDKTDAFFVIKWSWDKQPLSSIPAQYLKHSSSQAAPLITGSGAGVMKSWLLLQKDTFVIKSIITLMIKQNRVILSPQEVWTEEKPGPWKSRKILMCTARRRFL